MITGPGELFLWTAAAYLVGMFTGWAIAHWSDGP